MNLRGKLEHQYFTVRGWTDHLSQSLSDEDCMLSATDDTSPAKWHLAHTTWFFETFILRQWRPDFPTFNPTYNYLFNSYYQILGSYLPKKNRSLLSQPSRAEICEYRAHVDQAIRLFFQEASGSQFQSLAQKLELGLHHEQQHQELLLMDTQRNFFENPGHHPYPFENTASLANLADPAKAFYSFSEGVYEIGFSGKGFHYDNEGDQHRVFAEAFDLGTKLVTNREYLEFIEQGGYENSLFWLSDGWSCAQKNNWQAPLYWRKNEDARYCEFSLGGWSDLELDRPVAHVSYYEAQAYACFRKARLPTEAEWEIAARMQALLETKPIHQMHGHAWQWTQSAYLPYPHYVPFGESLGEYNSKFMCNQFVLRGGCPFTPKGHYRPTYRNFFYPHQQWQWSGIRLARNGSGA